MTLNGVMAIFCINALKAVAFITNYVKLTVARLILSLRKMWPRYSSFEQCIYGDVHTYYVEQVHQGEIPRVQSENVGFDHLESWSLWS